METIKRQWCMVLLLSTVVTAVSRGQANIPNSGKECAICHIRWVETFEQSKSQQTSKKIRMQEVIKRQAGSGDMCLSCHDGSVVDSRFKVWSTRHHTTGIVPPASVHIPTDIFPLDARGRMTCATCHTAHAVSKNSDLRTVIFLRRPNVDSSLCLYCHPDHAQKSDIQHPLGHIKFPIPQEILDAGGKTAKDGQTIICQTCHEPHGARNPWMLVLPPSKLCIACHTDKNPETNPPAGAPVHHIGEAYPGFKPPASLVKAKATFGPNDELSCLSCHRLHDASGAKPLLIEKNQDSSLCLECHPQQKPVLGSAHDLRLSSPKTVNAKGRTAAESGPCGACHRVHGWARHVPDSHRPHSSGCLECHQTGGPAAPDRPYTAAHPMGRPLPKDMVTSLPLDKATGRIGCLTCHNPHQPGTADTNTPAPPPSKPGLQNTHIVMPVPPAHAKAQKPYSFLRREGSQLCLLCHGKLPDLLGRLHDPNGFTPALRRKLSLYPAIGPCRVCHAAHNAQGPTLWAHTPATGAGKIANLCGACHEDKRGLQGSVHDPNTAQWAQKLGFVSKGSCLDCHPVHDPNQPPGIWKVIGPTEPNNAPKGGLPSCQSCHRAGGPAKAMETAHLGRTLGVGVGNLPAQMVLGPGRKIVCVTCHDIHQNSKNSKLLVAPLPRLCGTCHPGQTGIKGSVHDPNTANWAKKLKYVSQGSCIDCHPIHGPRGKGGLWPSIGGGESTAQSCQTCHRSGAPGPVVKTPHLAKRLNDPPDNLPAGMHLGPDQHLKCTTCHDIHQAQQNPKLFALPQPLRKTSPAGESGICLVCHSQAQGLINTPHDLRTSAPKTLTIHGETADVSGPCGSCHFVHTDPNTGGLWAQELPSQDANIPPAGGPGSDRCTCCHRTGGCASTRVPSSINHPNVALLNPTRPGQPDFMPTFNAQRQESQTGVIACLTCHDPHDGPSTPVDDNDVSVSSGHRKFLRSPSSQRLCDACHGPEALWRFLFFHNKQRKPASGSLLNRTVAPSQ